MTFSSFIKNLPKPVIYSGKVYFFGVITYNGTLTFADSKKYLTKFKENRLNDNEREFIKTEWDAIKYGSEKYALERLWDSVIWPIKLTNNFIPFVVFSIFSSK